MALHKISTSSVCLLIFNFIPATYQSCDSSMVKSLCNSYSGINGTIAVYDSQNPSVCYMFMGPNDTLATFDQGFGNCAGRIGPPWFAFASVFDYGRLATFYTLTYYTNIMTMLAAYGVSQSVAIGAYNDMRPGKGLYEFYWARTTSVDPMCYILCNGTSPQCPPVANTMGCGSAPNWSGTPAWLSNATTTSTASSSSSTTAATSSATRPTTTISTRSSTVTSSTSSGMATSTSTTPPSSYNAKTSTSSSTSITSSTSTSLPTSTSSAMISSTVSTAAPATTSTSITVSTPTIYSTTPTRTSNPTVTPSTTPTTTTLPSSSTTSSTMPPMSSAPVTASTTGLSSAISSSTSLTTSIVPEASSSTTLATRPSSTVLSTASTTSIFPSTTSSTVPQTNTYSTVVPSTASITTTSNAPLTTSGSTSPASIMSTPSSTTSVLSTVTSNSSVTSNTSTSAASLSTFSSSSTVPSTSSASVTTSSTSPSTPPASMSSGTTAMASSTAVPTTTLSPMMTSAVSSYASLLATATTTGLRTSISPTAQTTSISPLISSTFTSPITTAVVSSTTQNISTTSSMATFPTSSSSALSSSTSTAPIQTTLQTASTNAPTSSLKPGSSLEYSTSSLSMFSSGQSTTANSTIIVSTPLSASSISTNVSSSTTAPASTSISSTAPASIFSPTPTLSSSSIPSSVVTSTGSNSTSVLTSLSITTRVNIMSSTIITTTANNNLSTAATSTGMNKSSSAATAPFETSSASSSASSSSETTNTIPSLLTSSLSSASSTDATTTANITADTTPTTGFDRSSTVATASTAGAATNSSGTNSTSSVPNTNAAAAIASAVASTNSAITVISPVTTVAATTILPNSIIANNNSSNVFSTSIHSSTPMPAITSSPALASSGNTALLTTSAAQTQSATMPPTKVISVTPSANNPTYSTETMSATTQTLSPYMANTASVRSSATVPAAVTSAVITSRDITSPGPTLTIPFSTLIASTLGGASTNSIGITGSSSTDGSRASILSSSTSIELPSSSTDLSVGGTAVVAGSTLGQNTFQTMDTRSVMITPSTIGLAQNESIFVSTVSASPVYEIATAMSVTTPKVTKTVPAMIASAMQPLSMTVATSASAHLITSNNSINTTTILVLSNVSNVQSSTMAPEISENAVATAAHTDIMLLSKAANDLAPSSVVPLNVNFPLPANPPLSISTALMPVQSKTPVALITTGEPSSGDNVGSSSLPYGCPMSAVSGLDASLDTIISSCLSLQPMTASPDAALLGTPPETNSRTNISSMPASPVSNIAAANSGTTQADIASKWAASNVESMAPMQASLLPLDPATVEAELLFRPTSTMSPFSLQSKIVSIGIPVSKTPDTIPSLTPNAQVTQSMARNENNQLLVSLSPLLISDPNAQVAVLSPRAPDVSKPDVVASTPALMALSPSAATEVLKLLPLALQSAKVTVSSRLSYGPDTLPATYQPSPLPNLSPGLAKTQAALADPLAVSPETAVGKPDVKDPELVASQKMSEIELQPTVSMTEIRGPYPSAPNARLLASPAADSTPQSVQTQPNSSPQLLAASYVNAVTAERETTDRTLPLAMSLGPKLTQFSESPSDVHSVSSSGYPDTQSIQPNSPMTNHSTLKHNQSELSDLGSPTLPMRTTSPQAMSENSLPPFSQPPELLPNPILEPAVDSKLSSLQKQIPENSSLMPPADPAPNHPATSPINLSPALVTGSIFNIPTTSTNNNSPAQSSSPPDDAASRPLMASSEWSRVSEEHLSPSGMAISTSPTGLTQEASRPESNDEVPQTMPASFLTDASQAPPPVVSSSSADNKGPDPPVEGPVTVPREYAFVDPMTKNIRLAASVLHSLGCVWVIGAAGACLLLGFITEFRSRDRQLPTSQELSLFVCHLMILLCHDSTQKHNLCIATAVIIQYFTLVYFTVLMMDAIRSFSIMTGFIQRVKEEVLGWSQLIGWTIPMCLVAASSALYFHHYTAKYSCWINLGSNIAYFTIAPVAMLSIVNLVLTEASGMHGSGQFTASNTDQAIAESYKSCLVARHGMFVILPLSVASWGLGLSAVYYQRLEVYATVCSINIGLGSSVFFFHALQNHKIQALLHRIYLRVKGRLCG